MNWSSISSGNGLSPIRRLAIDLTKAALLSSIPLVNIESKCKTFYSRKDIWKSLPNGGNFVQGEWVNSELIQVFYRSCFLNMGMKNVFETTRFVAIMASVSLKISLARIFFAYRVWCISIAWKKYDTSVLTHYYLVMAYAVRDLGHHCFMMPVGNQAIPWTIVQFSGNKPLPGTMTTYNQLEPKEVNVLKI